jgi:hypothetical protein
MEGDERYAVFDRAVLRGARDCEESAEMVRVIVDGADWEAIGDYLGTAIAQASEGS